MRRYRWIGAYSFVMIRTLIRFLIHKFFYFLVSRGVKYNANYRGTYSIIPEVEKSVSYNEKDDKEATEKLAEIIDTYLKYDLKATTLSIFLRCLSDADLHCYVDIVPGVKGKCWICFDVTSHGIHSEETFFAWVNLCKDVFVRFNLAYGSLRDEYEDPIPLDVDAFLKEEPNYVNFYSKPLVDKIGREKLLSAPVYKVEALENGGIMLVVCALYDDQIGCLNEIRKLWSYLGYR